MCIRDRQWIVCIDQKGVVELLPQAFFEGAKAGKIHNKPAGIQLRCGEPEVETAAVPMHKTAMSFMAPLPMAAGITAEGFAAAVGGRRNEQEGEYAEWSTLREDSGVNRMSEA